MKRGWKGALCFLMPRRYESGRHWAGSQCLLAVGMGGYEKDGRRWDPIKAVRRSRPAAMYRFHIHSFVSLHPKFPNPSGYRDQIRSPT